jgi:hypothetical protein
VYAFSPVTVQVWLVPAAAGAGGLPNCEAPAKLASVIAAVD